jgi:hypothetical protein
VRRSLSLLAKLDKKYFTFGRSLKNLPTYRMVLHRSGKITRLASSWARTLHADVRAHFLRDMVRDGSVKLNKCAGTQNVANALTKSLPRHAFHKHREFLKGKAQSFSA